MARPSKEHWQAAKATVRYLAGTIDYGIVYKGNGGLSVHGYCDADYAGDIETRRSKTGSLIVMNGGAIDWRSHLQTTVAVSSAESEFMAAAGTTKAALCVRKLLQDFDYKVDTIKIFCDNQAAISLLKNPISSVRSKHIDVIWHFVRERVSRGEVIFEYLSTDKMVADCMTKALPESSFARCRAGMGVYQ